MHKLRTSDQVADIGAVAISIEGIRPHHGGAFLSQNHFTSISRPAAPAKTDSEIRTIFQPTEETHKPPLLPHTHAVTHGDLAPIQPYFACQYHCARQYLNPHSPHPSKNQKIHWLSDFTIKETLSSPTRLSLNAAQSVGRVDRAP